MLRWSIFEQSELEILDDSEPFEGRVCAYFSGDEVVKILERRAAIEDRKQEFEQGK